MSDSLISEELLESLRCIAEKQNAQLRQSTTMLAGFIAMDERDIDYMDSFMDPLFDFMDPMSDTEHLMRQYYAHISTFDPDEAVRRFRELENDMGYYARVVLAAGLIAKKLHTGQTDKGGNDYFGSHILKVAMCGSDWKEKVVGFLHDVAEDTSASAEEALSMVESRLNEIVHTDESEWWEDWMDQILPYPSESTFFIQRDDRSEILAALNLLNHHNSSSREEYTEGISKNPLALKVKLNDLKSNMDLTRIPNPSEKDRQRMARYQKEYAFLLDALQDPS